jgi:hypothetical protein
MMLKQAIAKTRSRLVCAFTCRMFYPETESTCFSALDGVCLPLLVLLHFVLRRCVIMFLFISQPLLTRTVNPFILFDFEKSRGVSKSFALLVKRYKTSSCPTYFLLPDRFRSRVAILIVYKVLSIDNTPDHPL